MVEDWNRRDVKGMAELFSEKKVQIGFMEARRSETVSNHPCPIPPKTGIG